MLSVIKILPIEKEDVKEKTEKDNIYSCLDNEKDLFTHKKNLDWEEDLFTLKKSSIDSIDSASTVHSNRCYYYDYYYGIIYDYCYGNTSDTTQYFPSHNDFYHNDF
ncbi:hypothetical protein [Thermodesulfovibrio sp. 3462-1]|uniref:Uncharacterized protein n=1 Tax=Thermodesulfovibrio obliviosus TaxID=3118332 RepID=A0AAU8GZE6_9BACT